MKDFVLVRFRPYVNPDIVYTIGRVSEATGESLGSVLTSLLGESQTFIELSKNDYARDEKLESIFRGPCFGKETCNNKEKKEIT